MLASFLMESYGDKDGRITLQRFQTMVKENESLVRAYFSGFNEGVWHCRGGELPAGLQGGRTPLQVRTGSTCRDY